MPAETLVTPDAIEVTCPECESVPNDKCVTWIAGQPYDMADLHPERQVAADRALACPACGEQDEDLLVTRSADTVAGEVTYTLCQPCGWQGDPR